MTGIISNNIGPVTQPTPLFGMYGSGTVGPLNKPMGVAYYNRQIYVTDTNNKRVVVFDYDGHPLYTFGTQGTGHGQFQFPYGIAVDNNGLVYVADLYNSNIQVFTSSGKFVRDFVSTSSKTLQKPAGLFFYNSRLYVTDVDKNQVFAFDSNGKKVLQFGTRGAGPGQFQSPNFVTVTPSHIYVSDTGNDRVEAFDPSGKFQAIINGNPGQTQSAFVNTRGIAVDGRGTLYVVSNLTDMVYGFDTTKYARAYTPFGSLGDANNQFALPDGLCVDPEGRIYIADSMNQRIMVYQN